MKISLQTILILLLATGGGVRAFGWGTKGHQIVAQIAENNLTPQTLSQVNALLDGETMVGVCMWADQVRGTDEFRFTAPYHYVNVPRSANSVNIQRDCAANGCVVKAIVDYNSQLTDSQLNNQTRKEALMFVIHFAGDEHCPMHVSYADDRGGNDTPVIWDGATTNLHRIWDSNIIESRGLSMQAYVADLNQQAANGAIAGGFFVLDPDDTTSSVLHWADETLSAMKSTAYQFAAGEDLNGAYRERAIPIVNSQLYHAGHRLAALLNQAFDPQSETGSTSSSLTLY